MTPPSSPCSRVPGSQTLPSTPSLPPPHGAPSPFPAHGSACPESSSLQAAAMSVEHLPVPPLVNNDTLKTKPQSLFPSKKLQQVRAGMQRETKPWNSCIAVACKRRASSEDTRSWRADLGAWYLTLKDSFFFSIFVFLFITRIEKGTSWQMFWSLSAGSLYC